MFLILLKISQLCLTKCPKGYGSSERSRATHDCPLVQYNMDIPPFWPYPPIHPLYIFRKQIKPSFNFPCNSKLTFFGLSNFVCILSIFSL